MAWQDRQQEAAYTSASGGRIAFDYEDVRYTQELRGTAFQFPDANGTYVQRMGRSGRQYPLRVFLWGTDYDLTAKAFEDLLGEPGLGKLEHPIYGTLQVVPFGSVTRRDDLKTAANQAVFEVTFWETRGLVYPTAQSDPGAEVLAAVDTYNTAVAEQFEQVVTLENEAQRASLKNTYEALLGLAESTLRPIADGQENVRRQFDAVAASINAGIDALIADPLSLAFQTVLLLEAPARAAAGIKARLNAYEDLANAMLSGDGAAVRSVSDGREANAFHARDLFASTYVAGSVLSVVNNQFETKTDALQAALDILDQFQAVAEWGDENYTALGQVDTGAAYQALQEAAALTAGFLVSISFSLKQERRLVLDRARTLIDLSAELYGSVENERLDFLISSNRLTGSEILEIPRGREIVYYV